MVIEHEGFEDFSKGTFGNGGDNLFVDANGTIRRIMDNDLNGDGIFDIVLPNSHGYIEKGPTYIYSLKNSEWGKFQLPNDSGWLPKAVDVDGDGYLDLIIANGENGISSALQSYIYWGGPNGLTGQYTAFDTVGAYDVAVYDLTGNGLMDVIFTTAWYDHHNAGVPLYQKVFIQQSDRKFTDATEEFKISGVATVSLVCEDLNNDGNPDLVLANQREHYNYNNNSYIYYGTEDGFDTSNPVFLPTEFATNVIAVDLNNNGFKDLVFTCSGKIIIYFSNKGLFNVDNCTIINVEGIYSQFVTDLLGTDVADIDGDGIPELIIGTKEGIEIRKANQLQNVWQKISCYGCSRVKAVDIKNTGKPDIIASNYCATKTYDTQSLVFWNSEKGFSINNTTAFNTHGPMGCIAADLNNDGEKEIIFCNTMKGPTQYDPEFPVFAYYGTPEFKYKKENRIDYPVYLMSHSYVSADVDNDGYVELILTSAHGIRIFKGTPNGPDPTNYYDLLHPLGKKVLIGGVLVGDFNHDGWLDLIMAPWVNGQSREEVENSVFVYYGGPDGYSDNRRTALPACPGSAQCLLLADINNDGYTDFIYGDIAGYIGVYYGGPDGFDRNCFGKINLKDHNGAKIYRITAVDIDKSGWLDLVVTTAGHYTRLASHLYILKDGKNNYPQDKIFKFETGGTTGLPAFADMSGNGNLDLILPFYSTTESRELPARIFKGDGKGHFDWDNPIKIDCLASIATLPVDLNGNGFPDLFICCHRNNEGHIVNSKLIRNGPKGLDVNNAEDILGYGPHNFTIKEQGNTRDRSYNEYYTSPVFKCNKPKRLLWKGHTPFKTSLSFCLRFGKSKEEVLHSKWSSAINKSNSMIRAPKDIKYMQYKVAFNAPAMVNSPKLKSVKIECHS